MGWLAFGGICTAHTNTELDVKFKGQGLREDILKWYSSMGHDHSEHLRYQKTFHAVCRCSDTFGITLRILWIPNLYARKISTLLYANICITSFHPVQTLISYGFLRSGCHLQLTMNRHVTGHPRGYRVLNDAFVYISSFKHQSDF